MFAWESDLQNTWDLHSAAQVNTCDVDQGIHNTFAVPTSGLNESEYVTMW